MNEIPENLKSALEKYADNNLAMECDSKIQSLNDKRDLILEQVTAVDLELEQATSQYTDRLKEVEEYITAQVFELGTSLDYAGVEVKHVSGYVRETWNGKSINKILLDNPALIPTFKPAKKETQVKPRVKITYTGIVDEPETEKKESVQFSREDYEAKKADTPF